MKIFASTLLALSVITTANLALAGPKCTDQSADHWQNQDTFQAQLKAQGYAIKKFKVTKGNCYEIYGHNKAGKKVEIYFNPIDGSIAKQEIDD
jgi:hypothetical protein